MENQGGTPEAKSNPEEKVIQQLPFDDRKGHYESLITLFKYAIGSLTLLIALVGSIIGYTTYSDGKEMRASIREQQRDLRQSMDAITQKEQEMQKLLLELVKTTREEVAATGDRAISQIKAVRDESTSIARVEARKRIEQVFEENKIEDFIVQVAKESLEPEVQQIVEKKIVEISQKRFEKAMADLQSNNPQRIELAYFYISNADPLEWKEEQVMRIIEVLRKLSDKSHFKTDICLYLALTRSPLVDEFLTQELTNKPNETIGNYAAHYLIRNKGPEIFNAYWEAYKKIPIANRDDFFTGMIIGSSENSNPGFLEMCLNYKVLIDSLFHEIESHEIRDRQSVEQFRLDVDGILRAVEKSPDDYHDTYFYTKK
jgi:hypothetical protein